MDLEPLRALLAGEAGLQGVRAEGLTGGVNLSGDVASPAAMERALDLAVASLPDGIPVQNHLQVVELQSLRALLAGEAGLRGVRAEGIADGVNLSGDVASRAAVELALDLAATSLPDGMPVQNDLQVVDLEPLRALLAGEAGLQGVRAEGLADGVSLAGEVASEAAVERVLDLVAASLPEGMPVGNGLRVADLRPLRELLAAEPGLLGVHAEGLVGEVTLVGDVASQAAVGRALELSAVSLPEGIPVKNGLRVADLEPLRELLAAEPGLHGVHAEALVRGVTLMGDVASPASAEHAVDLAAASLPEGIPVENSLRVVDLEPLRELLAAEPGLGHMQVQRLPASVSLSGDVDSPEAAERALRIAVASLPEGIPVDDNLNVGLGLTSTRAVLSGEVGLESVQVRRLGRGVALTGKVAWAEAAERAGRLAAASLPEGTPLENNLRVVFDVEPLRSALAAEPALEGVELKRLARGVALAGNVASPKAADRALRLAAASLPEGLLVENNLNVVHDLAQLRALLAREQGLEGVRVQRVGRGTALTGEVSSPDAAERAHRLAVGALPEGTPVENGVRVVFELAPLRAVLAGEPGLDRVLVQRLARGVALAGEVDSPADADRALRLAAASLPEGLLVENNLSVGLDLGPLRALLAGEPGSQDLSPLGTFIAGQPGLEGVAVQRVGRGVALTGEVASAEAADRAYRLAVASLPETVPVENNLRVLFDIEPLRTVLALEPGLERVQVQRLARGVALAGEVDSHAAADRALRLSAASLPEGLLVESNLRVVLDLAPLRALMAGEPGLERVVPKRVGRGVALTGEVASAEAADRAHRLAVAALPESLPVENNVRIVFDIEPLRAVLAGEPELAGVRVLRLAGGVVLTGEVASAEAADRAQRIASASLPGSVPVESTVRVVLDMEPLRAALALEPDLDRVQVHRLARGIALSGDVDSPVAEDRALRLASASLPEGVPVENNLNVGLDIGPLVSVIAGESDLASVRVERTGRGVALVGEVGSVAAAEQASRLATALLPQGVPVQNSLRVVLDIAPLRALIAGAPELGLVEVQRLARGVALTGDVDSHAAADLAFRLATASLPEGMLVESSLNVRLDLAPLRVLLAGEAGLRNVRVKRVGRGVALTGEVGSAEASDRAARLAVASLPEGVAVENNLRTVLDTGPLRAALGADPEFDRVQVRELAHGVSLRGEVSSAAAVDRAHRLAAVSLPSDTKVENELRIAGPLQVNLEVQIAEVQRSIAEDFGFNWELFGRSAEGVVGGGFRIGRQLPPLYGGGQPLIGTPGTIPPSVVDGLASPSLILSRTWEEIGITGMVEALAKAGLANVLARPNVTANSGEVASFFSGGEFPLPSGFKDGVIVFEYKKYGVVLDFVPTIMDEGRIELTVRPEVSEPSRDNSVQVTQGIDVPVINVRRAETTVAMGDGESIVIAGLFSSASNEVQSGVPLLKDLPLVGGIFGHTSTRADELELIVTVTARLVEAGPAPDEALAAGFGQAGNSYYY